MEDGRPVAERIDGYSQLTGRMMLPPRASSEIFEYDFSKASGDLSQQDSSKNRFINSVSISLTEIPHIFAGLDIYRGNEWLSAILIFSPPPAR